MQSQQHEVCFASLKQTNLQVKSGASLRSSGLTKNNGKIKRRRRAVFPAKKMKKSKEKLKIAEDVCEQERELNQ